MKRIVLNVVLMCLVLGCSRRPYAGPDKQFAGSLEGAATGAGAGAVTGFQVGAGTGPGAAVGAGLGAVAGGIQGFAFDQQEESLLDLAGRTYEERQRAYAHDILNEHYLRRKELHPSRDIFPADLFFKGDSGVLRGEAKGLVKELAYLNKSRLPWSRLVVAAYVKANDEKSPYAEQLAEQRSKEICDYFVREGIEPRRLEARAVVISEPILIDPQDRADRYNQAVEIIPIDR